MPAKKKAAPRPRRKRSLIGRVLQSIEAHPMRFWMTIGGALAVIVPAWTGIKWIDEHTDPIQLTSHSYLYDKVGSVDQKAEKIGTQNTAILRELQIDTAKGKREATLNDIKKWQLEAEKPGIDASLKEFIKQQIDTLNATRDNLDAQIKTLTAIKEK